MLLAKLPCSRRQFSPLRGSPAGWLIGLPSPRGLSRPCSIIDSLSFSLAYLLLPWKTHEEWVE